MASLVLASVVVTPVSSVVDPLPVVVAQAAPASSAAPTVPATSIPPSSTTRPTVGEDALESLESEALALLARPIRADLEPRSEFIDGSVSEGDAVVGVDEEAGVDEVDGVVEVVGMVDTVDLAVPAVDLVGDSGRAATTEEALVVQPVPDDPFECHQRARQLDLTDEFGRYDRNLVAQMTHTIFGCVASVGGLDDSAPTSRGWDAASIWGFENLSRQVAAEAVVVAYCESIAFSPSALGSDNPWGYGGLFQMGDREMSLHGFPGASKFDPVDNAYSAATYFMSGVRRGHRWGGWGPWAVVNTGYNDEVNDRVKVPVLPRFTSTDPDYRGRRGVELPAWAVDPWSYEVPGFQGCPTTGRAWPVAEPLA